MKSESLKNLLSVILAIAVATFLFSLKIYPNLFSKKTPGSYEFVRKGEALLDRGKYKDSVGYFEKAYESSPKEEVIKSDLAYSYSKYGMTLAESKYYADAIEYFSKAYNLLPNSSTKQNLAIIYAKKALDEARKGDSIKAIEDFTEARLVASGSNNASKSLGISIFNDAVEEYKAGKEQIAILCLKEAMLVYEDSRILEFLGDIYYKRAALENASFCWERAMGLDPSSKTLPAKLEKLGKEMELAKTEDEKQFPHFELRYGRGLPIDPELAGEILEKAYLDVGKDLAYFPSSKTVIFFYSEKDFRDIFKLPKMVMAFYDGNIRMPFPGKAGNKNEFIHYIYHEYTHAVVSAKTNNNCPVWFSEGIAVWEEFKRQDPAMKSLFAGTVDNPTISIQAIEDAFARQGDANKDMRPYYLMAYSIVKFIVDTWGVEGLQGVLTRIGKGQHIVNAIDDEMLMSEKDFDKRWSNYLKSKYFSNSRAD